MIHLASSGRLPESPPTHINMRCCYHRDKPEMDLAKQSSSTEKIVKEGESTVKVLDVEKDMSGSDHEDGESMETSTSLEHDQNKHTERSLNIDKSFSGSASSRESSEPKLIEDIKHMAKSESRKKEQEGSREDISKWESRNGECITQDTPPVPKQTWTLRTFTSFRKSSPRQSGTPKQNNNYPSKDTVSTDTNPAKFEDEVKLQFARYSMENPAFRDDDIEEMQEQEKEFFQSGRIIDVIPCNK